MKLNFLGATRTTTGSMYLLEINQKRILLECGLYQGKRAESIARNTGFPFDPAGIDTVVLSHAHIDHTGNLPNLCKRGFNGDIHCTFATRDLASIMLVDSAHIQEGDARFLSKHLARKGQPPVEPLYTSEDAEKAIRQFVTIGYDRPQSLTQGVTLTFRDAGHILGSAQVILDLEEGGRKLRFLFTGDLGRGNDPILRDPDPVDGVDVLQIESTYGTREHEDKTEAKGQVLSLVVQTLKNQGKVIVPAFAIGRTQQFVYELHQLMRAHQMPAVPTYVDSPLGVNATEIYRLHPECFNPSIYRFLREVANPFEMENLTYIRDVAQSKKLNDLKGAAIIISASGMAEAGRILHHLKNNVGDPRNLILFIGYSAENTLGAALMGGKNPVNIFGEPHVVKAKVASADFLSGHADRSELLDHVEKRITGNLQKICVVHGEENEAQGLAEALRTLRPGAKVLAPERGQAEEL
jgi:metallo-beta-lactamase family protein